MDISFKVPEGLITPPPAPPVPIVNKHIYNLSDAASQQMARNQLINSIFGMTLVAGGMGIFGYIVYKIYKEDPTEGTYTPPKYSGYSKTDEKESK